MKKGIITPSTVFIPERQDTAVCLAEMDFEKYGFQMPMIRHLWKFHKPETMKRLELGAPMPLNSISFDRKNPERFEASLSFKAAVPGTANAVVLSSTTALAEGVSIGDTDSLNGPVAIPISPVEA